MKRYPDMFAAVHALVGGALTGSEKFSSFIYHDEQEPPTEDAANAKLAELVAEYDAEEYQRDRVPLYPEIGEQLDLLYHDMAAGKGTKDGEWYKAVKKIKDDNPKPA